MTASRTELTARLGLALSALAALLVLLPVQGGAVLGSLLLACVPAGAAVMCWRDAGEPAAQIGLVVVISLAALAIASAAMIWSDAWSPKALVALAAVGIVSCGLRLRHGRTA